MKPPEHESVRSSLWPRVRKDYLRAFPLCAGCGTKRKLLRVQIDVHHVVPYHVDRTKELVETNLITLCRGLRKNKSQCHFHLGHLGNWQGYNPNVVIDAALNLTTLKDVRAGA